MVLFFFSDDGEGLMCLVVAVMVVYSSILLVLCCLYAYQLCIVIFMNTSNICFAGVYRQKICLNISILAKRYRSEKVLLLYKIIDTYF
jgi:hypothetical protein